MNKEVLSEENQELLKRLKRRCERTVSQFSFDFLKDKRPIECDLGGEWMGTIHLDREENGQVPVTIISKNPIKTEIIEIEINKRGE